MRSTIRVTVSVKVDVAAILQWLAAIIFFLN